MKIPKLKFNKNTFYIVSAVILVFVILLFVYTGRQFGNQSRRAMYISLEFKGDVKIGNGSWEPYVKGKHIPATKGDVTLKGNFDMIAPDDGSNLGPISQDVDIALYMNHIGGRISEDGGEWIYLDSELSSSSDDVCGVMYISYDYLGGDELTIELTNPHKFGNENAIDNLLDNVSSYSGIIFDNDMFNEGKTQRTVGSALMLSAFLILGTALFSMLIHIKASKNLFLVGFSVLFAAMYLMFSADGVMYWSEIIKFNTRMLGMSMMLYMLSVESIIVFSLRKKTRKAGEVLFYLATMVTVVLMLISANGKIKFYDTWFVWAVFQCVICVILTSFLIHGFVTSQKNEEILYAFGMLPVISFIIDTVATYVGWWQGGNMSLVVFVFLFFGALVMLLRVIPKNINAALNAQKLEDEKNILKAELADSRIAIMISQIQPHFIYNTLGTIEQLCLTEPKAASKLVRNFTLYLRGNFSELDNTRPIRFSKEMEHVKHYTDIEQVRFPDMTIKYDLRSVDFVLPALSVQPLVENAIKHGLMGLEEGGVVTITAYETESEYVVEVTDDGVGFDISEGYDEKKHVGIKNIRGRIEAMSRGSLTIESEPGKGTKATLKIPKEGNGSDSYNS